MGNHYKWHRVIGLGAPYAGANWIRPRYEGGQFYQGYWEGDRGRIEHDHRWDHHHDRDYHWNKGHEHHEHEEHERH